MIDKFDPTTNRVPFELLTDEEKKILMNWPHGIEFYFDGGRVYPQGWYDTNTTTWNSDTVYRGKPLRKQQKRTKTYDNRNLLGSTMVLSCLQYWYRGNRI
jgi:hypothetical protein